MAVREGVNIPVSRRDAVMASASLLERLRRFHPELDVNPEEEQALEKPAEPKPLYSLPSASVSMTITARYGGQTFWCRQNISFARRQPKIAEILKAVCKHYNVDQTDLISERRPRTIATPRQVAMYLSRKMTGRSLPYIGSKLGRDHTTVLHGVRKIERKIGSNPDLAQEVDMISQKILGVA